MLDKRGVKKVIWISVYKEIFAINGISPPEN